MTPSFSLIEVPEKFLDHEKWAQVRAFASSKLEALSYLNAPRPDSAADFFWNGSGSDSDALRCYRLGKSLLTECRSRFIAGELIASGFTRNGVKQLIPQALWVDLFPMFTTDRIVGRTRQFTNITIYEGDRTQFECQLNECVAWLKRRRFEREDSKKLWHREAVKYFGPELTVRMFETSYKAVFDRRRGRPRVN